MQFTLVTTSDGSLSCRDSETGELCHNRVGAYTEALEHYIKPSGLIERLRQTSRLCVLDACFGLGYNTWVLTAEVVRAHAEKPFKTPCALTVIGVEFSAEILSFLPRVLDHPDLNDLKFKTTPLEHNIYYRTLECICDTMDGVQLTMDVVDGFVIDIAVFRADLRQVARYLHVPLDAVFHDPFSPQKMPELWTADLFSVYHRLLRAHDGLLLTYSAAAGVRGGMQEAGFALRKTQPLGQKSGGTLGLASSSQEGPQPGVPLTEDELAYLQTRAGIPYRDNSDFNAAREDLLAHRLAEQMASDRPSGQHARKQLGL